MTEGKAHGGTLAVAAAQAHGVDTMFTLSGGHVFPLYDAAVHADPPMRLLDVRHEQTAVFAAEATARLTRLPGLAVLTAGPGVTNGVSAVTTAAFNGSPVVILGGRAPDARWGSGSLQEFDHPELLRPITKRAWTEHETAKVGTGVDEAFRLAAEPHRGPVFVDVSLEALYGPASPESPGPGGTMVRAARPGTAQPVGGDPAGAAAIAGLIAGARRPVLVLGSDVWMGGAEQAARTAAEELRLPVIANGQGRGILPRGHELLVTRARSVAFREADLVVVVGTPLDFRLGYGAFGDQNYPQRKTSVVHVADAPGQLAAHLPLAASYAGDLGGFLRGPGRPGGLAGAARPGAVGGLLAPPAAGRGARSGRRRRRAAGQRGRSHPPDAGLRRAGRDAGRRRGGDRRRRGLRVLRGQVHRAGPPGRMARPGPVRLPGHRAGLRDRGPAWPGRRTRWCCCSGTARPGSR